MSFKWAEIIVRNRLGASGETKHLKGSLQGCVNFCTQPYMCVNIKIMHLFLCYTDTKLM